MPSITDKFGRASLVTDVAIATTVKTTRVAGVNVLEAFDLSKYATDTPVFFVTYKKTTDPVTGIVSVTNLVSYKALVNSGANTLTNLTVAPGYIDLGNAVGDFIECIPTSYWENSLMDGLFVGFNPDGTFKASAVNDALQSILDTGLNAALANQLFYQNLIINGGCMVAQRTVPNISTTYQYGRVDRFAVKATGTAVSAGTIDQNTSALVAATKGYELKVSGLTVTGTGILFVRYRVEAKDAINFINAAASFGVRVHQNSGGSLNYTIYVNKANAADNFAATTAIANSGTISVPNNAATLIKLENINAGNLGDVSNGIEIEIQVACGAVTTKNFTFAEFMFNRGAKVGTFNLRTYQEELRNCLRYYYFHTSGNGAYVSGIGSAYIGGGQSWIQVPTPVPLRTTPVVGYANLGVRYGGSDFGMSSVSVANLFAGNVNLVGVTTGTGNGNAGVGWISPSGLLTFDAEL